MVTPKLKKVKVMFIFSHKVLRKNRQFSCKMLMGDEALIEKLDTGVGWSTPMPDEDWTSGHLSMCQAVADAIASGEEVPGDAELGVEVTSLVYAAYVSAAEGRRVVLSELDSPGD